MDVSRVGLTVTFQQPLVSRAADRSADEVDKVRQILERLEARRIVTASLAARESIEGLHAALKMPGLGRGSAAATTRSSASFALSANATPTTLRSTDQINTETTEFSPANPPWSLTSTADPTISGLYNGDQGTGDLTFTVTRWGLRGVREARIDVNGPVGEFISEIRIKRSDPIEQAYDVGNGLSVTFDGDFWALGDTFQVSVAEDVEQIPDPDTPFNADPNFETGVSVGAGTFEINGEIINVAADDTINLVLDSINSSNANVTAAYDSATESIILTHNVPGSGSTITLENDTSGFVAATRLASAVPVPGTDSDLESPIASVGSLSGISAGTMLVNGLGIDIDPGADSLNDILQAINSSAAGAQVRLLNESSIVVYATNGEDLTLDSNGTGFFEALNVASDTYRGETGSSNASSPTLNRVFTETRNVTRALNKLFDTPDFAPASDALTALRSDVAGTLADSLKTLSNQGIDLGLKIDTALKPFELRIVDQSGLGFRRALRSNYDAVRNEFLGTSQTTRQGLLAELLEKLQASVFGQFNSGYLIDTLA